jgi:hypothetical protein
MKVQYDVFLFFDRVGRMHEKKYFFFVFDIIFLQYFKENQIFYYQIYIFTVYKYKSIWTQNDKKKLVRKSQRSFSKDLEFFLKKLFFNI